MAPARRDGAGLGRHAPGAPPSPVSPSPTCWFQLNGDCHDPAHGLVSKAAARVVHRGRFVVVEKSRLAAAVAAGCAAHAGKAPMDISR
jgi:hypothetical protein